MNGLPRRAALLVMGASGFAGLGYQIVWTQQGALWLGHEAAAVLAVVAAFFGGLAIGAFAVGTRVARSDRPQRWYAACELLIAAWSIVLAGVMAPIGDVMLGLIGAEPTPAWQWAVAFGGTLVLLLPATAAMGATLPAMERILDAGGGRGDIATLYAANTFGAVVGVLAAAFWLVPQFGLLGTAAVCAVLNVGCAAAALAWRPGRPEPAAHRPAGRGRALIALTGLLGIGYEVLVVRVLSQVTEDTVYTFALLLAVYLLGTALGAAAYRRRLAALAPPQRLQDRLLCLQAAACLLGTLALWAAESARDLLLQALPPGLWPALAAETALALLAFGAPTVVMGALFSHLATQARSADLALGTVLGWNTLGAAAAPMLFGVLLVPAVGAKGALLLIVAGYLALAARRRALGDWPFWVPAGAALLVAGLAPPLAFVDVPAGGRLLDYRDGALGAVSVVEDAAGVARLRINNRQQEGSSATVFADARQALLPLLLHPAPRHALFLGLGTGVTAHAAASDTALQVDAVELLPEVIAASTHFDAAFPEVAGSPRLHVAAADARRFVRTSTTRYDLVVADNFHPARSGSGALYTVEHFRAVRGRLADHGLFCQWIPLHQVDLGTLRSIARSFATVYPHASALIATHSLETPVIGFVGRADDARFDLHALRERLRTVRTTQPPAAFGIGDEFALLGSFVAGPSALARFAADAPLNTDDHPVVAYRAPRITYAPDSLPRDRLLALLDELDARPDELVDASGDAAWSARLSAYWTARKRFLQAGRTAQPDADVRRMLAQVREPLLGVLRTSADFRPAYDPLLRMAAALARSEPAQARPLLIELDRLQPSRPEAREVLARIDAAAR